MYTLRGNSPLASCPPKVLQSSGGRQEEADTTPRLEESFTIHLDSQMKQMHNIRILSGDALDFCQVKLQNSGNLDPQPQRLQTALALYSNDLCGIVLLTDSHVGSYSGLTKELCAVCDQSTEFHFPPIDDQLEKMREEIKEAVLWRNSHCHHEHLATLTSSEQQVIYNSNMSGSATYDFYFKLKDQALKALKRICEQEMYTILHITIWLKYM